MVSVLLLKFRVRDYEDLVPVMLNKLSRNDIFIPG